MDVGLAVAGGTRLDRMADVGPGVQPTRRFREETGVAPMAWLTDARIDRARVLLETTTEPVEHIGRLTGLGAPASVRAAFHRRIAEGIPGILPRRTSAGVICQVSLDIARIPSIIPGIFPGRC